MFMSTEQRELLEMQDEQRSRMRQHRERCRTLPPLARGEAERLLKAFVESGGTIKACPTRYALPTA
jgi:hypothetical protein